MLFHWKFGPGFVPFAEAFHDLSCFKDLIETWSDLETRKTREARNSYWKGRISTIYLLVLTSSDQLLFIPKKYSLHETSYLNKELNCTMPWPSVRVPWTKGSTVELLALTNCVFKIFFQSIFPLFDKKDSFNRRWLVERCTP